MVEAEGQYSDQPFAGQQRKRNHARGRCRGKQGGVPFELGKLADRRHQLGLPHRGSPSGEHWSVECDLGDLRDELSGNARNPTS